MPQVTTSAAALANIGWNIEDADKGHDLEIHWGFNSGAPVRAMRPDVDGGDWLPYAIDYDQWINEDLLSLKEANELENEQY